MLFRSKDSALAVLQTIADGDSSLTEGPVKLGNAKDMMSSKAIRDIAQHYVAAFRQNLTSYPYFVS